MLVLIDNGALAGSAVADRTNQQQIDASMIGLPGKLSDA